MRRALVALAAGALLVGMSAAPALATAQPPGCDVESATLEWGFKESFRAYIDGSIANGSWEVADGATYETPSFGFTTEEGRVDPRGPVGAVEFPGAVRFTGHGGVLDTTVSNPVLVLRNDGTALVLLDVSGPTMEGEPVDEREVPFVELDLTGQDLEPVEGIVTIDAAPASLTEEGAAAFPNYPAGEAFDPVTATMDVGPCDLEGQPIGSDSSEPGEWPLGELLPILIVGGVLVVGVVVTVAVARRRR